MRTFDAVTPFLKKSWDKLLIGLVVLIIVDVLQVYIPDIIRKTIDLLGTENFTQKEIAKNAVWIVVLALGIVGMRYIWRMLIIGNSHLLEKQLRENFYKHLMRLSQNYFNFSKIGDLMALATNDLNAVRMLFGIGLIAGADIFLMATLAFAFMIRINPTLTLLAILPMPLLSFMIWYSGRKMHKRFAAVQASFSTLSGMIQESISGIRVVKAFAQEEAELHKMEQHSQDFVVENIKLAKVSGIFHSSLTVIISCSVVIVMIFGGHAVIKGEITIGGFIAFFSYLGMLTWPMIAIGWVVDLYQRGSASLKRLNQIWMTSPDIIDDEFTDHDITQIDGNIEIRNLRFAYKTEETKDEIVILNDISTKLEKGQTLAICGKTGCGKTTFIDLLCRVYDPPKDTIFIDGNDIQKIPITLLRNSVVMVPQDIFLFSDTIANNIALGNPNATQTDIELAARMAAVYTDIIEFENGFETIIGERGVTLSGGQKQRIAIARALITDPKILILDDALSAVDTKTEKEILKNLIHLRHDKTNIIIAHRISALAHANNIIVIDEGKIAEHGTHQQLIKKAGIYKELHEKQKIEEKLDN